MPEPQVEEGDVPVLPPSLLRNMLMKKNTCWKSFSNWIEFDLSKPSDHQRHCNYSMQSTFKTTCIAISMSN